MAQILKLADVVITSITVNEDGTFSGTWKPGENQPAVTVPQAGERWVNVEDARHAARELGLNTSVAGRALQGLTIPRTKDAEAKRFLKSLTRAGAFELSALQQALADPAFEAYYMSVKGVGSVSLNILRRVVDHLASQPAE